MQLHNDNRSASRAQLSDSAEIVLDDSTDIVLVKNVQSPSVILPSPILPLSQNDAARNLFTPESTSRLNQQRVPSNLGTDGNRTEPRCIACGVSAENDGALQAHISSEHLDYTPYRCEYCPLLRMTTLQLLAQHQTEKHFGKAFFKTPYRGDQQKEIRLEVMFRQSILYQADGTTYGANASNIPSQTFETDTTNPLPETRNLKPLASNFSTTKNNLRPQNAIIPSLFSAITPTQRKHNAVLPIPVLSPNKGVHSVSNGRCAKVDKKVKKTTQQLSDSMLAQTEQNKKKENIKVHDVLPPLKQPTVDKTAEKTSQQPSYLNVQPGSHQALVQTTQHNKREEKYVGEVLAPLKLPLPLVVTDRSIGKKEAKNDTTSEGEQQEKQCRFCGKIFTRPTHLNDHLYAIHLAKIRAVYRYTCQECPFKAGDRRSTRKHKRVTSHVVLDRKEEVDAQLKAACILPEDKPEALGGKVKSNNFHKGKIDSPSGLPDPIRQDCKQAGQKTSRKRSKIDTNLSPSQESLATHQPPSKRSVRCSLCAHWFSRSDKLLNHLYSYHLGIVRKTYRYRCTDSECRQMTGSYRWFTKHKKKHIVTDRKAKVEPYLDRMLNRMPLALDQQFSINSKKLLVTTYTRKTWGF